ncbi:protein-disulfide reductase DsbD domain-containing protein [Rhodovulum kholense]|uniref:DsbC/DsbD-like thiol-disulfide interchange protein n=1 Tax=Rhodovulum kholense TaxID=453584 RepID=A0A8E3AQU0_9RHOB|nr:protein-disulfide reductase DsbD domain-containing protein [Rhodovulum kholense]PTW50068.1 DsbC/DsbD-like thiol-disulfide interchange protein [Rhodovulum kholense]
MARNLFVPITAALILAAQALTSPAPAETALPPDSVVSGEILPGWQTERGTYMAALHLTLAPGWKTYWRAPGDAGIPPRFDWHGSKNVAAVRLHWPRPTVFSSNGMRTIGYVDDLVLPIELTAREPGRPMEIRARIDLGVCHDICMPMELRLDERLPGESRAAPIRAALEAQPLDARAARVGQVACEVEPISDGLRLTARIEVPPLGGDETAVFELPDPSIWVAETDMDREGGMLVARSDIVPADGTPFALDRSSVRITLLGQDRAVDIRGCGGAR